jgi:hypothetical protein
VRLDSWRKNRDVPNWEMVVGRSVCSTNRSRKRFSVREGGQCVLRVGRASGQTSTARALRPIPPPVSESSSARMGKLLRLRTQLLHRIHHRWRVLLNVCLARMRINATTKSSSATSGSQGGIDTVVCLFGFRNRALAPVNTCCFLCYGRAQWANRKTIAPNR